MGEKDIGFDADMEDSVKITADAALMELVWNNLLSNAVKFTEPGGTIKLTEQSDDSEIRVSVEDNGCGMTEETRKHIFEKFYQGIRLMQWLEMDLDWRFPCVFCS